MHAFRGYRFCQFIVDYEDINVDGLFDTKKPLYIPKHKTFEGIRSALRFIEKKCLGCFVRLSFTHEESAGHIDRMVETEICSRKTMLARALDGGFVMADIRQEALPISVHVTAKRDRSLDEWRYYETRAIAEKEIRAQCLKHDMIIDHTEVG